MASNTSGELFFIECKNSLKTRKREESFVLIARYFPQKNRFIRCKGGNEKKVKPTMAAFLR